MDVVTSVLKHLRNYRASFSDGVVLIRLKAFPVLLICVTFEILCPLAKHVKITDQTLPTK